MKHTVLYFKDRWEHGSISAKWREASTWTNAPSSLTRIFFGVGTLSQCRLHLNVESNSLQIFGAVRQHTRVLIVHDTDLKRQDAINYNLILVGGKRSNGWTTKIMQQGQIQGKLACSDIEFLVKVKNFFELEIVSTMNQR